MKEEFYSEDKILGGRVKIIQHIKGYRAAIDPVLLAAAVPAQNGQRVLEIGSGNGAASFSLAVRVPSALVTGLEIQQQLVQMAKKSARLNRRGEKVRFVLGDLLHPPKCLSNSPFDHVMANPPHLAKGTGIQPSNPQKARAYVEGEATLADWIYFALSRVCVGGTITFIHRYDRREEVLEALAKGAGKISVYPLWPTELGKNAKRVIIRGLKGIVGPTKWKQGLVLHDLNGGFSREAVEVLEEVKELMV